MTSKEILEKYFGYTNFRTGQEEIIDTIRNNKSVLVILPTGGGKSICYQIPALMSSSFSIVISPLIALMKDQVDALNKIEHIAASINSELDSQAVDKVLRLIASGKIKIVYVSPEKLSNRYFAEKLKSLMPSYLFIDEAHCISQWGHNFRPSYRKIKDFIEFSGIKNISAFTATATEEVRKDIILQLGLENPSVFVKGFERDNLHLNVIHTKQKKEKTVEIIKHNQQPAIVYTSTRKHAEEVADFLRSNKINAVHYHAGLTNELRRMIQDDFISGRVNTIVSTNAFGMGIDKSDIRTVIHFNLPGSLENYYQEIGRAGRDGKDSNIYLLYLEKDEQIHEYFISSSNPSKEQIESVYAAICNHGKIAVGIMPDKDIRIDTDFFNFIKTKAIGKGLIDSSIRVLEESGYLRYKSEFEQNHEGQFIIEPTRLKKILVDFNDNELKDLILLLLREYGSKIFTSRTRLHIAKLCGSLEISENTLFISLKRLMQIGIFSYEAPSISPAVVLTQPRVISSQLIINLKRMMELNRNAHEKLEQMTGYCFTKTCRFKYILDYFGEIESNYKCGKCDNCIGKTEYSQNVSGYLEEIILQTLHELIRPVSKRNVSKIISGKTSIALFRKLSTFNSCPHFKKEEIENAISGLVSSKFILENHDLVSLSEKGIETIVSAKINPEQNPENPEYEQELKLFNLLRQARKEAADRFNQPQDLICPDGILRLIANKKPDSHSGLLNIKGFNLRMFNKVGDNFLNIVKEHSTLESLNEGLKKKNIPENTAKILELIQKKYSLQDISSLSHLPEAIISTQIETLIEMIPELEINHLFDKNELKAIYEKIDLGIKDLKSLREELGKSISYAKIRIALAKKRVS
jgi:ATP-dependent DNA helicase RecQ